MYRITTRPARVGDIILCAGFYVRVEKIILHEPGQHPESPIHNHIQAREYVTSEGSRWDAPGYSYHVHAYEEV